MKFTNPIVLFILFSISIISSCKNEKNSTSETQQIVLRLENSPKGLNPVINLSSADNIINHVLFLPFADYNPVSLAYEPILMEELPSPKIETEGIYQGKIRYDITIIPEAVWDDGSPITGYDYQFTLKSIFHPKTNAIRYRTFLNKIYDCQVNQEDPKKLSIFIEEKNIAEMELITSIPILPKHIYDAKKSLENISIPDLKDESIYTQKANSNTQIDSFATAFNSVTFSREKIEGCGPYQFKEWLSDQFVSVIKKENHFTQKFDSPLTEAKPNEIIFQITPDKATAISQLKSGNLDIMYNLSFQEIEDLKNDSTYQEMYEFHSVKTPRYYYLALNGRRNSLASKEVRKALAYLVDVDTIISSYEKGLAERINSPFLSVDQYSEIKDIKYNRAKADQILADAGWKDTNGNDILDKLIDGKKVELELEFITTGSQLGLLIAGIFKQLAAPSGVKINIITKNQTEYKSILSKLDFDIVTSVNSQSLADYDPYNLLHTDNQDPGEGNIFNFGNDESDRLIELIRKTDLAEERKNAYLELEKILVEEQPIIFLYAPMMNIVYKKDLDGVISIKSPGFAINTFGKK